MKQDGLNILLKHGDLLHDGSVSNYQAKMNDAIKVKFGENREGLSSLFFTDYHVKNPNPSGQFVKVDGIVYGISAKLLSATNDIFEHQVEFFLNGNGQPNEGEIEKFKQQFIYELNRNAPLKEDKIEWVRTKLKNINKNLQELIGPKELIGPTIIPDYKKSTVCKFLENGIEFICWLKFDIYEGKEIKFFYYDSIRWKPHFEKIQSFLTDEKINKMFEAVLMDKKIDYLQELCIDLSNQKGLSFKQPIKKTAPFAIPGKLNENLEEQPGEDHQDRIKLTNPVISLFCYLVNESYTIKKEETEIVEMYCKKICAQFNLQYTDKVRQGFYSRYNKRNIVKVQQLILPSIDKISRERINDYIELGMK